MNSDVWAIENGKGIKTPGKLFSKTIDLGPLGPEDIYVAPLYGCWEANIQHAIQRQPVDICQQRKEAFIVPGNACVAQILEVGSKVEDLKPGDVCMGYGAVQSDPYGYPVTVVGYDAPNVVGILAKKTKLHQSNMIRLPHNSRFSLQQWAAFSARYVSAWSNWKVAFRCWKSQMENADTADHYVCAWGGGVSLAELQLAQMEGFQTIMVSSKEERINQIKENGITAMDRREFPDLGYQPRRYHKEEDYRKQYQKSERSFLQKLQELTGGKMISIFIENLGMPVYRATLRSLARQGVVATCGWKMGMELTNLRAIESINRHIHVHTHYATREEVVNAMDFAEQNSWMPELGDEKVYAWEEIPALGERYASESISSYFPIFEVNAPESLG